MTKPLISFIIPVYKVEPYLRWCIESIRKQTFADWEMVLVDDGSPDGCPAICDDYSSLDPRIKVIHQLNQGVAVARNQGLEAATGDWIWFVDSDDYIEDGALQKLAETIHQHDCDTIFFGMLDDNEGVISDKNGRTTDIFDLPKEVFLQRVFCYANPTMLFSRAILQSQNIRFTKGIRMAEDLELQYKYLLFCKLPVQIAENLYVYRHREGSAMTNSMTEKNNMIDCLKVAGNLADFVETYKIQEPVWFSLCIRRLLKSSLQSAERLTNKEIVGVKSSIKDVLVRFKELGYININDKTLQVATFSMPLYFLLLRIYYKKNGTR